MVNDSMVFVSPQTKKDRKCDPSNKLYIFEFRQSKRRMFSFSTTQLALTPTLTLIPAVRRGIEPLLPG